MFRRLSREDWEEIYYALDTKMRAIEAGKYDPEDSPGDNDKWIRHLATIMDKIGLDGVLAFNESTHDHIYSLQEIKHGTGFDRNAKFIHLTEE